MDLTGKLLRDTLYPSIKYTSSGALLALVDSEVYDRLSMSVALPIDNTIHDRLVDDIYQPEQGS